tara:strand:+ start:3559 stop:3744 length:186 start_codon:yes stop_codon:yes gene_type:complete
MDLLSKKISSHYDLVGITPGEVLINKENIDFRTITKSKADALFKAGCIYLRKKEKKSKSSE